MNRHAVTDESIERMVSILLRAGVSIAGAVVFTGGVYFLLRHSHEYADYHKFHGQPAIDRTIGGILEGVAQLRGRSIIQLGLLLLIATPIARVALAMVGFALEKDRAYVLITAIVLGVLLCSLFNGMGGG